MAVVQVTLRLLFLVAIIPGMYTTGRHHTEHQATDKPHVVFMLVDDWGWANVGYHRDPSSTHEVDTPNIDSLVKEGLELDQHYVYRFCSPSRSALISGRLPIHVNDTEKPTH